MATNPRTARLRHAGPDATEWTLTGIDDADRIRIDHTPGQPATATIYDDRHHRARHAGQWPPATPDAAILATMSISIDNEPDMRMETTITWRSDHDPDCIDTAGATWQTLRVLRRQTGISNDDAIRLRDAADHHPQAIRRHDHTHTHWDIPMTNTIAAAQWLTATRNPQPLPPLPPDTGIILSITLGPWNPTTN